MGQRRVAALAGAGLALLAGTAAAVAGVAYAQPVTPVETPISSTALSFEKFSRAISAGGSGAASLTVPCDEGEVAIGGGIQVVDAGGFRVSDLLASYPDPVQPRNWRFQVTSPRADGTYSITVVCATTSAPSSP